MSIFREIIGVLIILSILWSSGPWSENPQHGVDNAVVDPMSGTGFPFSLLLFHICNHLRFFLDLRVGLGGCGLLAPDHPQRCFSQFHHPG